MLFENMYLVLTRRKGQSVILHDGVITIKVLSIGRGQVDLGFDAPPGITIHREEVYKQMLEKTGRDLESLPKELLEIQEGGEYYIHNGKDVYTLTRKPRSQLYVLSPLEKEVIS